MLIPLMRDGTLAGSSILLRVPTGATGGLKSPPTTSHVNDSDPRVRTHIPLMRDGAPGSLRLSCVPTGAKGGLFETPYLSSPVTIWIRTLGSERMPDPSGLAAPSSALRSRVPTGASSFSGPNTRPASRDGAPVAFGYRASRREQLGGPCNGSPNFFSILDSAPSGPNARHAARDGML